MTTIGFGSNDDDDHDHEQNHDQHLIRNGFKFYVTIARFKFLTLSILIIPVLAKNDHRFPVWFLQ